MRLRIKPEYIDYSVGGSKMKQRRLQDIPESQYERYYKLFPGFFEVIEEDVKKSTKRSLKTKKNDDKNNTGNKSIGLSDTDREGDTK